MILPWQRRALAAGEETASVEVAGIGRFLITGRPAADPFIFGRLQRGEMFEPHILAALAALTPGGACVLDVGANLGLFTLCAGRLAGPGGQVVAVEPAPGNLRLLRRNLMQNGAAARVVAGAATDRRGTAWLSLSDANAGDHRVGSTSRPRARRVAAIRLDRLKLPADAVLTIKLDIQGSEVAALRGAEGLFGRAAPVRVLVEFWPFGLVDCGSSASALVDLLETHFQRFWLLWSHCGPVATSPAELRNRAITNLAPVTEMFADVVCLRAGDTAAIAAMEALSSAS